MPPELGLLVVVSFALIVAPPILLAVVLFLLPGRKGRLRSERTVTRANLTVGDARALYVARLETDRFTILPGTDPGWVLATRRPNAPSGAQAHADKPVDVELRFTPLPDATGVEVHATAKIGEFIFHDSGEGRMIDMTLDRLLSADLEREPRPVVPNLSFTAMSAATGAVLSLGVLALLALSTLSSKPTLARAAVATAAAIGAIGAIPISVVAWRQIRQRPAELWGLGSVYLALVAALATLLGAAALLYFRFHTVVAEALKRATP